ncbi:hypothetical protein OF83DRAFT_508972 [Amylostereum chailletii]|nr:hypothetical protein OF83DRAFT_508972 [Amylostereum chailletii]
MQFDGVMVPDKKTKVRDHTMSSHYHVADRSHVAHPQHPPKPFDNHPRAPSRRSTGDQRRESARDDKVEPPTVAHPIAAKSVPDAPEPPAPLHTGVSKELNDLKTHIMRLDVNTQRDMNVLTKAVETSTKDLIKKVDETRHDIDVLNKDLRRDVAFLCDTVQDIVDQLHTLQETQQLVLDRLGPTSSTPSEDVSPRTPLIQDEKQSTFDGEGAKSPVPPSGSVARDQDQRWEYNAEYASTVENEQSPLKRRLSDRLATDSEPFEQPPQGQSAQPHYRQPPNVSAPIHLYLPAPSDGFVLLGPIPPATVLQQPRQLRLQQ